jgi:hypothetical protein
VESRRRILILGETQLLHRLATALHRSPRLQVVEGNLNNPAGGEIPPDVILVDGAQVTPEQFRELLESAPFSRSVLISIDPSTYQLTVLSSPCRAQPLECIAQGIETLSFTLCQPA